MIISPTFPKYQELQTIQTFWSSVSDDLIYIYICYRLSSKNDFHETLRRISLITFPRHKDQEGWSYQMTKSKTIFEISHGVIYQYQTLKTLRWMTIPDFQWHKGCPNNNIPETARDMNVRIFVWKKEEKRWKTLVLFLKPKLDGFTMLSFMQCHERWYTASEMTCISTNFFLKKLKYHNKKCHYSLLGIQYSTELNTIQNLLLVKLKVHKFSFRLVYFINLQ